MWDKIASGKLNYSFTNGKLNWHKNPEKKHHEKELGNTLKEHKTKPSPTSDLYGHLKRGRKSNCYFQIVSWLFKNPQGTHPVRMFPQSPRLWKRIWAQTETLNVKMKLSSAWAGERNAEDRKREASLWVFLFGGEILAFWVCKMTVSEHCLQRLLTGLQNSVVQGWLGNKFRPRGCSHGSTS